MFLKGMHFSSYLTLKLNLVKCKCDLFGFDDVALVLQDAVQSDTDQTVILTDQRAEIRKEINTALPKKASLIFLFLKELSTKRSKTYNLLT